MCGEREWRLGGEDEGKYGSAVKMSMSDEMCVLECMDNKVVPEVCVVALLNLKTAVHTISVESTLALNPQCFRGKVVYVHAPGTHPPQCKPIHDSLSVLPKLEKSWETQSNTLHIANYCPNFIACTPLIQGPYVPKFLPRALTNIRHMPEWSTSSGWGCKSLWNK